jgi:phospholipid transport system substrate-binding protein
MDLRLVFRHFHTSESSCRISGVIAGQEETQGPYHPLGVAGFGRRIIMHRRHLLGAGTLALCGFSLISPVWAANAAEDFVSVSILKGFDILNDTGVPVAERRQRFATFLLGLTDVRRVALFLLGSYAAKADPADIDAYVAAYRDYVMSVYQSYFALYAGQSLRVVSSHERAPGDFVVTTQITGGNAATPIDFRVKTDGPQPLLLDVAVGGVWLGLAQRDQFMSVLAANNGDVKILTSHLRNITHA